MRMILQIPFPMGKCCLCSLPSTLYMSIFISMPRTVGVSNMARQLQPINTLDADY